MPGSGESAGWTVTRRLRAAAAVAALVTLATHAPGVANGFIDLYDDGPYVLQNPAVLRGVNVDGIVWAATAVHVHNWHPLTWISHMADVSLFGLEPWGHHLTSILLHAVNAGLVALLLGAMGAPPIAAGLAAVFFGVHPLRIQSVAWIAERKDVLSALFGLGTLLAWISWRRRGGAWRYAAALGLFALGLLSKPMLVSLPLVILLLETWPLGRLSRDARARHPSAVRDEALAIGPFLGLAVAVGLLTVWAQGSTGSFVAHDELPLTTRLANAATSLFGYVGMTVWPSGLAIFYPHPRRPLDAPVVLLALAGFAAITAGVLATRRRAPWLAVGWLWYVAMVAPVLGILQAGRQGMADRYTYLPSVGLLVAATFALVALANRLSPAARSAVAGATAAACLALALVTWARIPDWKDSEAVFRRALEATGANSVASTSLGVIAARRGDTVAAEAHFRAAIAADDRNAIPRQNLAALLMARGEVQEAWRQAEEAARLDPTNHLAYFLAGMGREQQGLLLEAAASYETALRLRPGFVPAQERLAGVRAALEQGAPGKRIP